MLCFPENIHCKLCIYMLPSTSVLKKQQTHCFFCIIVSEYAVGVEEGVCVIALSWKHRLSLLVINVQLAALDVEPREKWLSWEWTITSGAGTYCSVKAHLTTELKTESGEQPQLLADILESVFVSSALFLQLKKCQMCTMALVFLSANYC